MADKAFDLRQLTLITVDDLAVQLLWDGQKEDEDLPRGVIESLIANGALTIDDIVARFRTALTERLED